jgi:hypothetical protein
MACNYNLKIWKVKNSDMCYYCQDIDTIEHHLVECRDTNEFWKMIFNWLATNIKTWFQVETYEIIFSIPNERNETVVNQLSYILLGKYYVYKKKKKQEILHVYKFLLECRNQLNIKQEIMNATGKLRKFEKEWGYMSDNL